MKEKEAIEKANEVISSLEIVKEKIWERKYSTWNWKFLQINTKASIISEIISTYISNDLRSKGYTEECIAKKNPNSTFFITEYCKNIQNSIIEDYVELEIAATELLIVFLEEDFIQRKEIIQKLPIYDSIRMCHNSTIEDVAINHWGKNQIELENRPY